MLRQLRAKGLKLSVEGDKLIVGPRALLTDALRGLIRLNKAAMLQELADEERPRPLFPPWRGSRYGERGGRRRGRLGRSATA